MSEASKRLEELRKTYAEKQPLTGFIPIPEGIYQAEITKVSIVDEVIIKWEYTILKGEYTGKKLFNSNNLSWTPKDPTKPDGIVFFLTALQSLGIDRPADLTHNLIAAACNEAIGIICTIQVKHSESKGKVFANPSIQSVDRKPNSIATKQTKPQPKVESIKSMKQQVTNSMVEVDEDELEVDSLIDIGVKYNLFDKSTNSMTVVEVREEKPDGKYLVHGKIAGVIKSVIVPANRLTPLSEVEEPDPDMWKEEEFS